MPLEEIVYKQSYGYALGNTTTTRIAKAGVYKVTDALSANYLRDLRNEAIKAGDMPLATILREAQALRKKGQHGQVEALLTRHGLGTVSLSLRSTFPQERQLMERGYRVCHNLKRETEKKHLVSKPAPLPYANHENAFHSKVRVGVSLTLAEMAK
jgi:hypothetical protein